MQTEYRGWSLQCLLATGDASPTAAEVTYSGNVEYGSSSRSNPEGACSTLALRIPSAQLELRRGHTVHRLLSWLGEDGSSSSGSSSSRRPRFDFLLKVEMSTLVCFTMVTDLLEATVLRFGGGRRVYLGQLETCTRVQHTGLARRGDELHDVAFLEEVLNRKDATCAAKRSPPLYCA